MGGDRPETVKVRRKFDCRGERKNGVGVQCELARLYEEYGDLRTAELQLQQALQLDLNNSRVHASLGSVKEKMGDLPQALANYQRSYTLNTFQPGVPERIASLQQRVGTAPATNLAPAGTGPLRSAGASGFTNRSY